MDKQTLEIGHPLRIKVHWYDRVPEPPEDEICDGEVVGWRQSQMLIRVPNYSVIRIWKKNGLEVGNPDWRRRGFKVELSDIARSIKPQEVSIDMVVDTDA